MDENSSNSSKGVLGNTKPKPTQQSPAIRWCFTKNDIPQNEEEAIRFYSSYSSNIKQHLKYLSYQLEVGEKDKKYHIQGYFELLKKQRLTALKEIIDATAHFEPAKGSKEQNNAYTSKENTKVAPVIIYDKSKEPKYTAEELGLIPSDDLYEWQKQVLALANTKADRRTIHWFFETEGNVGKSETVRQLIHYHKFGLIDGKKKDIMCSIIGEDGTKDIMKGYVFNFSRDKEGKVSYDSMETIKDGLIFSSKYKSSGGIIPPVHIFVFANWKPDVTKMSLDRWKIYLIEDKKLELLKMPQKQDSEVEKALNEGLIVDFD